MDDAIMAMLRDPAMLANLQNTLTPAGLLTQWEAENQRQAEALAARTAAASAAATAAGAQYQQAAAAPPPQLDPLAQSLPLLLGNTAKALTGDAGFTQRAQQGIMGQQNDLMAARVQNLQALKDGYDAKARSAELAGNLEASIGARAKSEQLAKTLDVLLKKVDADNQAERDKAQHGYALEQIAARGAQDRRTQAAKPAASGTEDPNFNAADYVETTPAGRKYVNAARIPQAKYRQIVTNFARANGIPVLSEKGRAALDLVTAGRENLNSMREALAGKLSTDRNPTRIIIKGLKNKAAAVLQLDPKLTSYGAFRTAAVEAMQTIASLGVGFRINRDEIRLAMQNDIPSLGDTADTAENRLQILEKMFSHVEDAILQSTAAQPDPLEQYRKE